MPTLSDLAVRHTALDDADLEWMHSLVSDWQLLADLSFADLILWIPLRDGNGWIAIAQMRPTTGPTVYHDDVVGTIIAKGERELIDTAWAERRICREEIPTGPAGFRCGRRRSRYGGRTPADRRPSRATWGDPALDEPVVGAHAVPAGAHLPAERLRPGADGGRGAFPVLRRRADPGPLAPRR
nr:hypothetical protein GCM10020093_058560 [Planobispora longispora]